MHAAEAMTEVTEQDWRAWSKPESKVEDKAKDKAENKTENKSASVAKNSELFPAQRPKLPAWHGFCTVGVLEDSF